MVHSYSYLGVNLWWT